MCAFNRRTRPKRDFGWHQTKGQSRRAYCPLSRLRNFGVHLTEGLRPKGAYSIILAEADGRKEPPVELQPKVSSRRALCPCFLHFTILSPFSYKYCLKELQILIFHSKNLRTKNLMQMQSNKNLNAKKMQELKDKSRLKTKEIARYQHLPSFQKGL